MNIIGGVILGALILEYLLSTISTILNLKTLRTSLPEEFKDVYSGDTYKKSQEYTRAKSKFGILTETFGLIVLIIFWFSGGFNWLDGFVRQFGLGPILTGLMYIGILVIFKGVISLPFSIYATFVIEERFGFNKTTPKIFITDLIKSIILGIILGGPLLAGILALFTYGGSLAWLYCFGIVTIFSIFIQYVAPVWILPIFNKFTPLEEGELKQEIFSYANSVKFPLKGVFVMDGSKRSTKTNAFFTGFGKNKRIALFDTLISKHSIKEMVAILAHEIGHFKKKHIKKMMVFSIIHTGVIFYLLSIFMNNKNLFDAFMMQEVSVYGSLVFFGLLYTPLEFILGLVLNYISRKHEYEADRFAVETISEHETLMQALKKLSADNLSNLTPHPLYVFLNYSHPPILERIKKIQSVKSL